MILRASQAVSPILEQVSDDEAVEEFEERTFDDEEEDHCVSHLIDDESKIAREARQVRRQRHEHRPPSVEEMQEHLRTHLPHGSWCQHCVSGRGVSSQHRRRVCGEDSVEVATVAGDYCLRNTPGEDSIPVLVMRD